MKYSWQRQIILETIQEHKEHLSGAEYLRGWRTDFNDMTRHANRLNVSAQYNF